MICDFIISLSIEDLTLTLQPHSGKSFSDQSRVSLAMENSDNCNPFRFNNIDDLIRGGRSNLDL